MSGNLYLYDDVKPEVSMYSPPIVHGMSSIIIVWFEYGAQRAMRVYLGAGDQASRYRDESSRCPTAERLASYLV